MRKLKGHPDVAVVLVFWLTPVAFDMVSGPEERATCVCRAVAEARNLPDFEGRSRSVAAGHLVVR